MSGVAVPDEKFTKNRGGGGGDDGIPVPVHLPSIDTFRGLTAKCPHFAKHLQGNLKPEKITGPDLRPGQEAHDLRSHLFSQHSVSQRPRWTAFAKERMEGKY